MYNETKKKKLVSLSEHFDRGLKQQRAWLKINLGRKRPGAAEFGWLVIIHPILSTAPFLHWLRVIWESPKYFWSNKRSATSFYLPQYWEFLLLFFEDKRFMVHRIINIDRVRKQSYLMTWIFSKERSLILTLDKLVIIYLVKIFHLLSVEFLNEFLLLKFFNLN